MAFPLLLLATAFIGLGFGLTVPTLNTLTAAFHPDGVDSSVLVLNALLGVGTALAPALVVRGLRGCRRRHGTSLLRRGSPRLRAAWKGFPSIL